MNRILIVLTFIVLSVVRFNELIETSDEAALRMLFTNHQFLVITS